MACKQPPLHFIPPFPLAPPLRPCPSPLPPIPAAFLLPGTLPRSRIDEGLYEVPGAVEHPGGVQQVDGAQALGEVALQGGKDHAHLAIPRGERGACARGEAGEKQVGLGVQTGRAGSVHERRRDT